jgi:hypothetical protein
MVHYAGRILRHRKPKGLVDAQPANGSGNPVS